VRPIKGGQDKRQQKIDVSYMRAMNWELFDTDPIAARKHLTAILKAAEPDQNEVQIARDVARMELSHKLDRYNNLREQLGEFDEQVQTLYEDIKFWRLVLRGL
jgi:hypothetical protein